MPTRSELEHDDPAFPPWHGSPRPEEFDALADLFLTDPTRPTLPRLSLAPAAHADAPPAHDDDRAPAGVVAPPLERVAPDVAPPASVPRDSGALVEVEGLILGHLPVAAGAWSSQHAAWRASTLGGPVALVRVSTGLASIDLLGALSGDMSPATSDPATALDRAVARARRVIIRVDATDEPALAAHPAVSRLSLLTSADEPATLGAYRILKSILGAPSDVPQTREFRVVFLGSDPLAARRSGEKIRSACATFLDTDVTWEIGPERIAPAPAAPLHRAPCAGAERLLDEIAAAIDRASRLRVQPAPAPLESFAVDSIAPAHDSAAAMRAAEPPPRTPLASLLPDLCPLPLRCPAAPHVEFARGAGGVLHALHEAGPRAAESLLAAQAWARDNWATILLLPTPPDSTGLSERPLLRLHALGERFDDLRPLLGTPIHAHLLAPASTAARALPLSPDGD